MSRTNPYFSKLPVIEFLRILAPFFLWMFMFRDFISHKIGISIDTTTNYAFIKFYVNNLLNGVVPLWDPFIFLGAPFIMITGSGALNPAVFLVAILVKLGCNYSEAYTAYLVAYYFIGLVGFYLFSKSFFKDNFSAFVAYLLLLFSGAGASIFNQVNMLLIFVPSVWFFYFLINFGRFFKRSHFLGLTFCSMLILIFFLPFYFLTVFAIAGISFCLIYGPQAKEFLRRLLGFCRHSKILIIFCVFSVGVSLIPIFLMRSLETSKDLVFPERHCSSVDAATCYQTTLEGGSEMTYRQARGGSLGWRTSPWAQFSHLNKLDYAADALFYVPIFAYILIFISLFVYFDKKTLLLVSVGFLTALVSIADAAPVHQFLYDHIFYFKYFRNLFFFMVFIMPAVILLAVNQLKLILEHAVNHAKEKHGALILIFLLHGIFFLFLFKQGDIIQTSYITISGSMLFFLLYFAGYLKEKTSYFLVGLLALCVLQPVEVFNAYSRNALTFKCNLPNTHAYPRFSYERPSKRIESECLVYKHISEKREYLHDMLMQDSTGFIGYAGHAARWAFMLSQNLDPEVFLNYVRKKFVVYDRAEPLGYGEQSLAKLTNTLQNNVNLAFVSQSSVGEQGKPGEDLSGSKALAISGGSNELEVLSFDVNSLKLSTDFYSRKFLVYNDTFNHYWKVFVNGKQEKLYRANLAFKGLWVPAGKNIIYFKYNPPGGEGIYVFVAMYLYLFFVYALFMLNKEKAFFHE